MPYSLRQEDSSVSVHEDNPAKINDAWAEYLRETQGLSPDQYMQVEPYAWARLRAKLGQLKVARTVAA